MVYVPTLLTLGANYVTLLSELQNVVTLLAASQKHFVAQIKTGTERREILYPAIVPQNIILLIHMYISLIVHALK